MPGAASSNPWLKHVKATMAKYPKLKFRDVLIKAKATYKRKA
jgi:hypothetical protein